MPLKRRRGRLESLHEYIVWVPMERLAMDMAGPYPVTSLRNQYCLMMGCYFSKWLQYFTIPDQKATTVAQKLVYEIVAHYGAFRELHSDQGTNFGSKVMLEVCRLFSIHKTRTTPYHHRSDRFIERSFWTLGCCLKAACQGTRQEWDELVPLILMSYRVMPQASMGVNVKPGLDYSRRRCMKDTTMMERSRGESIRRESCHGYGPVLITKVVNKGRWSCESGESGSL